MTHLGSLGQRHLGQVPECVHEHLGQDAPLSLLERGLYAQVVVSLDPEIPDGGKW